MGCHRGNLKLGHYRELKSCPVCYIIPHNRAGLDGFLRDNYPGEWQERPTKRELLNPNMPADEIRLHMGEMTTQEMRTARAAIAWANTRIEGEVTK